MSRRAGLWIAFVFVHLIVAVLGFVLPNLPMGDVYLVYEPWARSAASGTAIMGVTEPWVYPQLALAPMMLALGIAWVAGYTVAWALVVIVANALAFALLVGRGRSTGRTLAAAFWLAFILLLGPVGMYRLDGVTVSLALAGSLWLVGRPLLAAILLSVATWMKVWPAALLAAAVIAVRRRLVVLGGALIVSAVTVALVASAGGAAHVLGFVEGQTGRGLQLEAPVTAWHLWQAVAGVDGAFVYYDSDILTFQVTGANVDAVIAVMTPLLALAVLAIAALGAVKAGRGAGFAVLFPPLALALVLAFIVFNKVGSPQFLAWIIAPVALGLVIDRRRWRWPAVGALAAALLTQFVYPLLYDRLIVADAFAAGVLTLRNVLLIALLVWAIVRVARVPGRLRRPAPSLT
ncbi:glycosyltransferase 87 family protein [Microbacterium sulfonylureivorans]|uniref:glycosyltransferase 87 family protein n=1 Tax=Microbacterium sulfonylureivorans TaxID=2486854 RepID=UPI0013E0AF00|nr:glycosyltransferase 87 family protein [Microbacterium sulfonylureivorans]